MTTPNTTQTMNYTFYWLTGRREVLQGSDPANALNRAGYGGGAVRALDFYAEGDDDRYAWLDGKWHNIEIMAELEPERLAAIEVGSVGGDRP